MYHRWWTQQHIFGRCLCKSFSTCTVVFGVILALYAPTPGHAFYVPGVAPVEFREGEVVEVKAVKMTSIKTQLPYEYYSLPFCRPKKGIVYKAENLGEILRGDRIVNTAYDVYMKKPQSCKQLCNDIVLTKSQALLVSQRIKEAYSVHLLVDNLPSATKFHSLDSKDVQYEHGIRLGFVRDQNAYLNNHLSLTIMYNTDDHDLYRVVGFEVQPRSVTYEEASACENGFPKTTKPQLISPTTDGQKVTMLRNFWLVVY